VQQALLVGYAQIGSLPEEHVTPIDFLLAASYADWGL
jgi:hypothetical protein